MGQKTFPGLFFLILSLTFCAPAKSSYFGESEWSGVTESGEEIFFSSLDKDQIALNVYSPDCVPCWKEIPALNFLHEQIQEKFPRKALYLVVDPYQTVPDLPEQAGWGEAFSKAKARMEKEKISRGIHLPILFMKPSFRVKEGALVTATPETLLFETKPLRLYYNFIGSISEETSLDAIRKDPKIEFFRHQFGMDGI
ncbi:TlpA family protein disulfide reductase [Leptospira idonii]|uniref:Thioredoxin domain-containing protein n=1 Tax=Leptospira idonii TaxID=1193500 RepID=A0A4R9M025_9LEPT|nr:hypothetical protein [Leptospira idonii]TGN19372.1 hypothetical protein EHS15_08485 [Leptospira idonii]